MENAVKDTAPEMLGPDDVVDFSSMEGFYTAARSLQCLPDDALKIQMTAAFAQGLLYI